MTHVLECEDREGLKADADAFILSINSERKKTEPLQPGKLRMFTVDLRGMQFFFFSHSLLYLLPDALVVRLPSLALLSHLCNAADIMTTRRNEIRNLKGGCGCLVISCEEGEEKQDPSLICDFIL